MRAPPAALLRLSLSLALATAAPAVLAGTAFAPSQAHAQALSAPVVNLVPGGELVADGSTEATLTFVAYGANGQPMTGLTGKVSGIGEGRLAEQAPGIYSVTVTPSRVTAREEGKVVLRARGPGGAIEGEFAVPLSPGASKRLTVKASPEQAVLGDASTVSISVKLQGGVPDGADIELRTSAGSIANVTPLGDGTYVAQYTAPPQKYPQLALITAVDRRTPTTTFGHYVLPLVGKVNFPVQGEPNSNVIVQVGDQPYGPVPADAQGKALVPIVVPPGNGTAKVISVVGGRRLEDPLDLQVPPSKRVSLFPVGVSVPADNTTGIPVRALVTRADGSPDPAATVTFTVGSGSVTAAEHEGGGIYSAVWTPAFGDAATASVQVSVADAKGPQADSMELKLAPGLASTVSIASEPPSLSPTTANFKLYVKAQGSTGGASGRPLAVDAAGAEMQGRPRDLGGGDYELAFQTVGNSDVDVAVSVGSTDTGNALSRVLAVPLTGRVTPDGQSLLRVAIVTVDAYGYPVGNVPVDVSVASGDGTVPGSITTGPQGVAFATYTAGRGTGYVTLNAEAGGHVGSAGFMQAGAGLTPVDAPVSGSASTVQLTKAWKAALGGITLDRAGASAAVATAVDASPAGPPSAIQVVVQPSSVAAGGAVTLDMTIVDSNGRPTEADPSKFVFLASTGQVSPVTSLGGGKFKAMLSVPADASGNVNLAVSLNGTPAAAPISTIPISGAVASAWGTDDGGQAEEPKPEEPKPEEPKPEEKPKKDKTPKKKVDRPWLRAGGGYLGGFYGYYEASLQSGGPIYEDPVTVGFGSDASAAGTAGAQLNAKMWLPMFEYVGFETGYQLSRWQIQLDADGEPIGDTMHKLNARAHGRYPLDVGAHRISFGGFVGFHTGDFLYFQQEESADPTADPSVTFNQLWTVGNSYGAEITGEFGKSFFATGTYELGFTDYSTVFSSLTELELGYAVMPEMYIFGNVGFNRRYTQVYFGDNKDLVGELNDQHLFFGLGLGYQM